MLYHQLTTPKVSFTEFNKIPYDKLIEIARAFVGHEQHTFQYFRETTDTEFFTNFREAIKTYHQKQNQTAIGPMIESSIRALKNFNKQYASIIRQTKYAAESIGVISKAAEQFREAQLSIVKSLRPAIEQYLLTARIVSEYLAPQINLWQNWVEQNRKIFDTYRRLWQTFQKTYQITEQEAIQILKKYRWFVTPSLPLTFIFEVVKNAGKKRQSAQNSKQIVC